MVTFQSRFGPEDGCSPYRQDGRAGQGKAADRDRNPGRPDCLETLEEIAVQAEENFHHNGGEKFTHIPCLNDSEDGMRVLETVVRRELMGWV